MALGRRRGLDGRLRTSCVVTRANRLKVRVAAALARAGYRLERVPRPDRLAKTHPDLEADFARVYELCAAYTATSAERMHAVWTAVRHLHRHRVPGDLVECGVWRGGSSMLAAMTLDKLGDEERRVFLFDTFSGMTEPTERDLDFHGTPVFPWWAASQNDGSEPPIAYASLAEVQANMAHTNLDPQRVVFVQGRVEDTIPGSAPDQIALLRLDTDWYESTKHELEHLWPRLSLGGVMIVDDYGHYLGAREAVDEFFASRSDAPLLNRIDYTGRLAVKAP